MRLRSYWYSMMMYKEKIKELCQEQTNLEQADIDHLVSKADELLKSSDYANEDVFIDVKNVYSEHAVVVFHKKPKTKDSLYAKTVVGEMAYLHNEPGVIRTLETGAPSIGLSARSQEGRSIHQTVFPILREGRVIGTLIVERDAHSVLPSHFYLKREQSGRAYEVVEALQDPELKQFALLEYLDDSVLVFDELGYLKYFNQAAKETYRSRLGYMDSIAGMHYDNLALDNISFDEARQKIWLADKDFSEQTEVEYGAFSFSLKRYIIPESHYLVMVCKDITAIRQKESQILLEEATMREMNHRIKNNLQTVVSLLRLQAQQSQGAEAKKALYDSVNRILSIATTHELLSSKGGDSIDVQALLKRIIENVQHYFAGHLEISLTYSLEPGIYLDSKRAISLAMIVNELLQNSYDHAFKGQVDEKNPCIRLQLGLKNDIMELKVTDNGDGYNVEESFGDHLGLLLVSRFVQSDLSGRLHITSDSRGTITTVTFKK